MVDRHQSAEELFLRHLDLIEKLLHIVAHRYALHGDEPDEFAAWVKLKMVEDGYAVLRKFRGEAKLRTFLTTVFVRLAKDWLIARRGKWRPSAAARRVGTTAAVQLEKLISYDGRTMEEAVEMVKQNFGARESREELRRLAEELPHHPPRSHVSLETLAEREADTSAESVLVVSETEERAHDVASALNETLTEMPVADRLMLQMHYERGMTIASISRALDVPQRPLYTRLDKLLGRLRDGLESRGVGSEEVRELFGWVDAEVPVNYQVEGSARRDTLSNGAER